MEFRRAPAAGNLFVNRIAIVKNIYLRGVRVAKFEWLDPKKPVYCRNECASILSPSRITWRFLVSLFLPLYFLRDSSSGGKTDKAGVRLFLVITIFTCIFIELNGMNFFSDLANVCEIKTRTLHFAVIFRWKYGNNALHIAFYLEFICIMRLLNLQFKII